MLVAVGVGSYSFSKKYVAKTGSPEQLLSTLANEGTPGQSWRNPAAIKLPSGGTAVSCGVTWSFLRSLDEVVADKEAVFVLLPGEDEDMSGNVSRHVDAVAKILSDQGRQVGAFTLEKHRKGYDQLIRQFSVQSLPGVIVVGRGCGSAAVTGEITETKLLQAFVWASMSPSSCGSAKTSSACCPK
jgi:hypothetical protein